MLLNGSRFIQLVLVAIAVLSLFWSHVSRLHQVLAYRYSSLCLQKHTNESYFSYASSRNSKANNRTLGFQDIVALSRGTQWRTRGLEAAAKHTEIDIRVLHQPKTGQESVDAFLHMGGDGKEHPSLGSAIAWMAHLDVLKYVIQQDYETVLIVEDDVDWDLRIKDQMMELSDAVRNYTSVPENVTAPYGLDWDILWIGNCGDFVNDDVHPFSWPDSTRVPVEEYRGWSQGYLDQLPHEQRHIYETVGGVCTFAYALTREGARKVLDLASPGHFSAYDLFLGMSACPSDALRCISVVPELFHHHRPNEKFGISSEIDEIEASEEFLTSDEVERTMGSTENIQHSARCEALFQTTCQGL